MQKLRFPKYSVAWDILFLVLVGLLLGLFANDNYRIPDPHFAIGLMLGLCVIIGTFRTRKPRIIYWGLQIFVWCLGLGICYTVQVIYNGDWRETFLPWLLVSIIFSALLAILYRPILSLLKFLLFKPSPKSDAQVADFYTPYTEYNNHPAMQEIKAHPHFD